MHGLISGVVNLKLKKVSCFLFVYQWLYINNKKIIYEVPKNTLEKDKHQKKFIKKAFEVLYLNVYYRPYDKALVLKSTHPNEYMYMKGELVKINPP